ncbi:MAG: helix-turn-helix domain-containing protein [Phycisphaerae bacterium]
MTTPELDLKARLRMAVAVVGTQSAAAEQIGISQARLSNYVRGENAPSVDVLARLARLTGVRLAWLRTGAGPVFEGEPGAVGADGEPLRPSEIIDLVGGRAQEDEAFRRRLLAYLGALAVDGSAAAPQVSSDAARPGAEPSAPPAPSAGAGPGDTEAAAPRTAPPPAAPPARPTSDARATAWPEAEILDAPDVARLRRERQGEFVPVVGEASAGLAFGWDEEAFPPREAATYVRAAGYPRTAFAMRVRGASMEPAVAEGCIVLFGEPAEPSGREGRPALAIYEDENGGLQYALKYVSARKDEIRLRPANEELFPTDVIPPDRLRRLYPVIGVLCPVRG